MKHNITSVNGLRVNNLVYKYPHSTEPMTIVGVELPGKITVLEKGASSKENMDVSLRLTISAPNGTFLCRGIPITEELIGKLTPKVKYVRTTPKGNTMYGNTKLGLYFSVNQANPGDSLQITGLQIDSTFNNIMEDACISLHQLQNYVYDMTNGKIQIKLQS